MIQKKWLAVATAVAALWTTQSPADWTDACCDIYPRGSDHTDKMIPRTFGQRQGAVSVTREDGVTHELTPVGDAPGHFRDQHGRPVYRQSGLGSAGQIYRFADESVYLYWDTAALNPSAHNPQLLPNAGSGQRPRSDQRTVHAPPLSFPQR